VFVEQADRAGRPDPLPLELELGVLVAAGTDCLPGPWRFRTTVVHIVLVEVAEPLSGCRFGAGNQLLAQMGESH
jgi:hypothetical protein